MEKRARIAVVGCGNMANSVHLPSLKEIPGCDVVAVCDLDPAKARASAERFGVPHWYISHPELLKNERLDGVVCLAEPDRQHRLVYDVLRSGHNCMMEKPAGIDSYQSDSLARVAEENGVTLAVAMNRRHIPLVQSVMKTMRELTPITQVDGTFIKCSDISRGWHYMNAFVSDIIHAVDLIRYLADSEPVKAATVANRFSGSPVDNAWSSVMMFENGITGTLKSNYQTAGRVHEFEIHGPKASAFINLGFGSAACDAIIIHSAGKDIYSMAAAGATDGGITRIDGIKLAGGSAYYQYYGYKQEEEDFVRFLLTGEKPLCTIADAAKSMHMAEMLLQAAI